MWARLAMLGVALTLAVVVPIANLPTIASAAGVAPAEIAATTVKLGGGDLVANKAGARVLNTASSVGGTPGKIAAGATRIVAVNGAAGVPAAGVGAIVARLSVITPTTTGSATLYPTGGAKPAAKTLTFGAGATRETLTIVALGAGGSVSLQNGAGVALDYTIDVTGYVPDTSTYSALPSPVRVLNTAAGVGSPAQPLAAAGSVSFATTGVGAIPSTGTRALVARITVTTPSVNGSATLYPAGVGRPAATTLAWKAGATAETLTIIAPGTGGRLTLHNEAASALPFTVEVLGTLPDTSTYSPLPTPARVLAPSAPVLASGGAVNIRVAGQLGVAAATDVGSVVARVSVIAPTVAGTATLYPADVTRPDIKTLKFNAGATVSTIAILKLAANGKVTLHNETARSLHFTVDVIGWFDAIGADEQSTTLVIPGTTRVAGQNDILKANADTTVVWLRPTADAPPVGGHLLVPPRTDGTRGVTAVVTGSKTTADGTKLALEWAPVYEVLSDMDTTFHRAISPPPGVTALGSGLHASSWSSGLGLSFPSGGESPITCTGSGDIDLGAIISSLRLALDNPILDFHYSISRRELRFAIGGTASFSAAAHIEGSYSCTYQQDLLHDIPMGWLTASVGVGFTVATDIGSGESDLAVQASAPAVLGFDHHDGNTQNLTSLSFHGSATPSGTGIGPSLSITPFVSLDFGLATSRAISPTIGVQLGMELKLAPNGDGYFGPQCNSVTIGPSFSLTAGLEIAFFPDIEVNLATYTPDPIHLWDGKCTSYSGSITASGTYHGSGDCPPGRCTADIHSNVTLSFDGSVPTKVEGSGFANSILRVGLNQPFTWSGSATEVDVNPAGCASSSTIIRTQPNVPMSPDERRDFLYFYDDFQPGPGTGFLTLFGHSSLEEENVSSWCDGGHSDTLSSPGSSLDIQCPNYDATNLPQLGPQGLAGPITGTLSCVELGNPEIHETVAYALSPVQVTPP